jgi:hypothetical protein
MHKPPVASSQSLGRPRVPAYLRSLALRLTPKHQGVTRDQASPRGKPPAALRKSGIIDMRVSPREVRPSSQSHKILPTHIARYRAPPLDYSKTDSKCLISFLLVFLYPFDSAAPFLRMSFFLFRSGEEAEVSRQVHYSVQQPRHETSR